MKISTSLMPEFTVTKLIRMVDVIDFAPAYQREGDVWRVETRQRLIDSIINGLDVPKLYFEREMARRTSPSGLTYRYAVLDGKQRLQAITEFMRGELSLPSDFWFFEDRDIKVQGWTLEQLRAHHPSLARRFTDFELPVVVVTSDSGDLVEEMFQRLNASSALNAAERRNAISGPTRNAANELAAHPLLVECSPIKSARYKYRELAAKFLAIEDQLTTRSRVLGTKATTLLKLFRDAQGERPRIKPEEMHTYAATAETVLDRMRDVFEPNDWLLASIGTVVVYYIVFRSDSGAAAAGRAQLSHFEELRRQAARMAEDEPDYALPANARLREYNVLVQSTNDGAALERRAAILSAFLLGYAAASPLAGLAGLGADVATEAASNLDPADEGDDDGDGTNEG